MSKDDFESCQFTSKSNLGQNMTFLIVSIHVKVKFRTKHDIFNRVNSRQKTIFHRVNSCQSQIQDIT